MTEQSDDCQIRINELISTFDQHDTLNIFGLNWQNDGCTGETGSTGFVHNNPLFDPCNLCSNCQPGTAPITIGGCNSCGSGYSGYTGSTGSTGSIGCGIIDWVQVLWFMNQCGYTGSGPFVKQNQAYAVVKPNAQPSVTYPFNVCVGPYNFTVYTDEENTFYSTLAQYFSAYLNAIENPTDQNKDDFNTVKMTLFSLICKYLQQDNTILPEEFPEIYSCGNQLQFQCWLYGIKSILCVKECGSKICCRNGTDNGSCNNSTGACGSTQNCKCAYKCENVVLNMLTQMSDMFDLSAAPGTLTTYFGTTGYSGYFNGITTVIGSTSIVLPDISDFLSGPSGMTLSPVLNSGTFNLGTLTYDFYSTYLQSILCPCSATAKSAVQTSIINLKTMIDFYVANPTILSNLLSNAYYSGTEFRSPNSGPMNAVQAAAWFGSFSNALSTMDTTLGTCSNCTSCCECKECCDTKILAGMYKLSQDMITDIVESGAWYNGATLITDEDQFLVLGGSGPTITSTINNCTLSLTFYDVGEYLPCDMSFDGSTGDSGPTGPTGTQIYLPNISILVTGRMCNTTTTIDLGSDAEEYYDAYIALTTAICDSNYATKLTTYQSALDELMNTVCLDNCPD